LLWWLPTAGLLIALTIALPAALRQWRATPPSPAMVRFTIFPPENTTFPAAGGSVPFVQLAVSPDGRRVAFVASPPGGRPALWVRALDEMQPRMLGGTEDAAYPFWSPDSRFVGFFAQSKLKKIDIAGDVPHVLCDATIDSRGGTWNRDDVIVFAPTTASGLFQVAAAGGMPTPLLNLRDGEFSYRWPSFLPDGRHFLFYIRAGTAQRGVYIGSLDNKTTTRVLDAPFSAVYSPPGYLLTVRDQALLAYPFDDRLMRVVGNPVRIAEHVGGSSSQMASFSVSANGVLGYAGGLTTLSRLEWYDRQGHALGTATDGGDYANFRLSPDARRVAVSQSDAQTNTGDLWLLEFPRNVPTRFTFDPANDTAPTWSPDGNRIVFRSDRAGGNFLFEKPAAGGEPERLLGAFDAPFPTDWSPDGTFILYHFPAANGNYDVNLVAPAKDAKPVPFASSPFTEIDGRFSADGRWIAYSSNESGRMEVYVQPFPRSGSMWQVSTGGGSEAHWRRDGKELFYLAPDRRIMAVAVRGGSTFEREGPRPLFQTRVPYPGSIYRMNYDVTADGARFLVNSPVEGAGSLPINVVLDWPAGLKK
jgi:Tol biopolymer transport system component